MMPDNGRLYGSLAAARAAGISLRQLYYWVSVLHVVTPQAHLHGQRTFQRFTAHDVEQVRKMKSLVDRGYTLRAAVHLVKRHGEVA